MNKPWPYTVPGIPDKDFYRAEGVPMTRSESRVLIISKLQLFPGAVVYDVGAGSGSVAVECALLGARVIALEKKARALDLLQRNARKFNVDLKIIAGEAPDVIHSLPRPQRVFVGGSGGKLKSVLKECHHQLLPGGRLVFAGVTMDNSPVVYRFLEKRGYLLEAIQVQTSVAQVKGGTVMWQGRNPVTIISGEKREE